MSSYYIGIDIGSTSAKVSVLDDEDRLVYTEVTPTGWSSVETANAIYEKLEKEGYNPSANPIVATGYGRVSVPYADKTVTEITCHGQGAAYLFGKNDIVIVDIGGQDTKIIELKGGMVNEFYMNDKCSAGTGRFLEVMGNTMGLRPGELCEFARGGNGVTISSMCTVFAESEVISLIGRGEKKENIAYAIVSSIADKVASQCGKINTEGRTVYLTGGLCDCSFMVECLSNKLRTEVVTKKESRFAGAIGAAILSKKVKK